MTKANPNIHIPTKRDTWGSIVVPGRRALGEQWTRLDISHDKDQVYVTNEGSAETPPDGKVQVVASEDAEYTNYILSALPEKIGERMSNPQEMSIEERTKLINDLWQDYWEQKLKEGRAASQFGPGGATLRQR